VLAAFIVGRDPGARVARYTAAGCSVRGGGVVKTSEEEALFRVVSQKRFEDRESFSIPVAYCAIPKS
jgi:hypothetical protein